MARKNAKRAVTNKIEPSELTLTFSLGITPLGQTTTKYIDLSQVASLVNRRFYRQGLNWAVAGFKALIPTAIDPVTTNPGNSLGTLTIKKLPNSWVMSNAWEKGMRAWNRMNSDALSETPSIRPKFLDFKIYADADHHTAGSIANLLPQNSGGVATPGEWTYSRISHPIGVGAVEGQTAEDEILAVGSNYPGASPVTGFNAVSLIEGYAASRGLPNIADPNTPADSADMNNFTPENWLGSMFNEGTEQNEDVVEAMISENNIAPYPFENDGVNLDTMYPGGANQLTGLMIHDTSFYSNSTIGGQVYMKGGNFPCGLIRIDHIANFNSTGPVEVLLQIDLVPGPTRGYLTEPMTRM